MPIDALEQLATARLKAKDRAREDRWSIFYGEKPWTVYDANLSDYLDSFEPVFSVGEFWHHLQHTIKDKGRKLHALDVAGQGEALRILMSTDYLESITAITLADSRSPLKKREDQVKGIKVIAGDVSVGSTWTIVKEKKFDLITCRPLGGLEALQYPGVYFAVFNRMYKKLETGGLLLTEVPKNVIRRVGDGWVEKLKQTPGLRVRFYREGDYLNPVLSLIRSEGAPKNLRFLKKTAPL